MTPIGHTLTGLAIGYLAIPNDTPRKQKVILLGAFALAASAPDLPLPFWGHTYFDASHSLVSAVAGSAILAVLLWIAFRGRSPMTLRVILGLGLAWCSHILLDSMYNHAWGLPYLWPIDPAARMKFLVPWLAPGDRGDIFSMHNLQVAVLEVLTFGPLLALSYFVKNSFVPVTNPTKTSEVQ